MSTHDLSPGAPPADPTDAAAYDAGWSGDAREVLDRQTEVLELIARAAPLQEVLTVILTSLEHLMQDGRCSVLLLDRDPGTLHHGAAPTLPADYVRAIDGMSIGDGAGSCGTAASQNAPVVAVDVATDPRWVDFRDCAAAAGLRSCWSTPIEGHDGLPVGTFAVYHSHPHRPTPREQLLVDRFTHLASVAIDHATLLDELVESEDRFRRSFDANALGMAILDPDSSVVTCNTALTALAGAHLVGRPLAGVVVSEGPSLPSRLDALSRGSAGPVTFGALLHRPDDGGRTAVEVEVTASLLCGREGSSVRFVVNVLDLTERRAAERHRRARLEAETARRTAEELSNAKSELLAAVGHEARTPIQAIVGFAELLGTIDLDAARRREALGHIGAAAGHVMDLLADVLDLSRLEANALPLAPEPVLVADAVKETFALLAVKAEQRGCSLAHHLTDEVVSADPRRLRQVLLNLVTNAIRHGNPGGRVEVAAEPAPDPAQVLLTVRDDGPGIPPELLSRIFTPYAHAVRSPHRGVVAVATDAAQEESIGLGLSLAHGLARAMGGDLTVGGSGPDGTTMRLLLPRPGRS